MKRNRFEDYGFKLFLDDGNLVVGGVYENIEALDQGMVPGEETIHVNGVGINDHDPCVSLKLIRNIMKRNKKLILQTTHQGGTLTRKLYRKVIFEPE